MQLDIELLRNNVLFTLKRKRLYNKRTLPKGAVQTESDQERVSSQVKLYVHKTYEAISKYQTEIYDWLKSRSQPSPIATGIYLVRRLMLDEVTEYINAADAKIQNELVPAFIAALPEIERTDRQALNGNFREADYTDLDAMRKAFSVGYNILKVGVADDLPEKIRQEEEQKLREQWETASQEIITSMRAGFAKLVNHMLDRLKTAPGEKPKVFRNSLTENLQEFFATFGAKNLMNDADLAALVNQAQAIMSGVDAQSLRDSAKVQDRIVTGFDAIKGELDKLLTEMPSRRFALDE